MLVITVLKLQLVCFLFHFSKSKLVEVSFSKEQGKSLYQDTSLSVGKDQRTNFSMKSV